MRPLSLGGLLTCVVLLAATPRVWSQLPTFRRGDSNVDSIVDISDAVHVLGFLFLGDPKELACQDAADADDSVSTPCAIDDARWLSYRAATRSSRATAFSRGAKFR